MKKRKGKFLRTLTAWLIAVNAVPATFSEEFKGKVIGVSDGDTITILFQGEQKKVRLSGIDCPEKTQDFGQQAKAFTSKFAFAKKVKVVSVGHDRYQRTIGEVFLPNGKNLNNLLLSNGFAWFYEQYSKDAKKRELETSARKAKLGLWSHKDPHAPWAYRKQRKNQTSVQADAVTP